MMSYINFHFFFKSLKKNCKGEYVNVDPRNDLCLRDIQTFTEVMHPRTHMFIVVLVFCTKQVDYILIWDQVMVFMFN